MAFNYANSAATALGLITNFGQPLTLTRSVPGAFNPATGGTGAPTVTTQTVLAVPLPGSEGVASKLDDRLQMALVKGKLRKVLIAPTKSDGSALDFEPGALDLLTFESFDWELVGVTPLKPAGVAVLFTALAIQGGQ